VGRLLSWLAKKEAPRRALGLETVGRPRMGRKRPAALKCSSLREGSLWNPEEPARIESVPGLRPHAGQASRQKPRLPRRGYSYRPKRSAPEGASVRRSWLALYGSGKGRHRFNTQAQYGFHPEPVREHPAGCSPKKAPPTRVRAGRSYLWMSSRRAWTASPGRLH